MCLAKLFYLNEWILRVMAVDIQLKLVTDTLCVNSCCYSILSFVKQCKHGVIHIIINKYD